MNEDDQMPCSSSAVNGSARRSDDNSNYVDRDMQVEDAKVTMTPCANFVVVPGDELRVNWTKSGVYANCAINMCAINAFRKTLITTKTFSAENARGSCIEILCKILFFWVKTNNHFVLVIVSLYFAILWRNWLIYHDTHFVLVSHFVV